MIFSRNILVLLVLAAILAAAFVFGFRNVEANVGSSREYVNRVMIECMEDAEVLASDWTGTKWETTKLLYEARIQLRAASIVRSRYLELE